MPCACSSAGPARTGSSWPTPHAACGPARTSPSTAGCCQPATSASYCAGGPPARKRCTRTNPQQACSACCTAPPPENCASCAPPTSTWPAPPSASAADPARSRWTRPPPPRCAAASTTTTAITTAGTRTFWSARKARPPQSQCRPATSRSSSPPRASPRPCCGSPGSLTWSPPSTRSSSLKPSASAAAPCCTTSPTPWTPPGSPTREHQAPPRIPSREPVRFGKRQVIIDRPGLGDLLDLAPLRKGELRRPPALKARVERIEPVGVEVADHIAEPFLAGEGHPRDRRHVHALGRQQHHLRSPPGHHRPTAPADDAQQAPPLVIVDLTHPQATSHRPSLEGSATATEVPRDPSPRPGS